jgi:hypothetical protein
MFLEVHVCMYVCMYIYIYTYIEAFFIVLIDKRAKSIGGIVLEGKGRNTLECQYVQ